MRYILLKGVFSCWCVLLLGSLACYIAFKRRSFLIQAKLKQLLLVNNRKKRGTLLLIEPTDISFSFCGFVGSAATNNLISISI